MKIRFIQYININKVYGVRRCDEKPIPWGKLLVSQPRSLTSSLPTTRPSPSRTLSLASPTPHYPSPIPKQTSSTTPGPITHNRSPTFHHPPSITRLPEPPHRPTHPLHDTPPTPRRLPASAPPLPHPQRLLPPHHHPPPPALPPPPRRQQQRRDHTPLGRERAPEGLATVREEVPAGGDEGRWRGEGV